MRHAILLALMLFASVCRGQFYNPATPADYETMHDYLNPKAQVIETLPWSDVKTKEFSHPAGESIEDHIRNHPMLGDELEKLHEWLHQKVERLRPNGARSFIVVEATEAEFAGWSNRGVIENAGWRIVHVPAKVAGRIRSVVALDKTHYSQAGFVTSEFLNRCNTQFQNRQFKPVKSARARFVTTITKYTRANCKACRDWERVEEPKAKADGVTVVPMNDSTNPVPWFEVRDSEGRVKTYVGYKSYNEMKRDVQ